MTEAHVITSLPLDGPWPQGSVGLPLTGSRSASTATTARRRRPARSARCSLRGPNLFREYWRKPEATRAAFATGWFDTGDLATSTTPGFLTLAGRKNDLIITSGFNVYPQVVERVINACPGVPRVGRARRARRPPRRAGGRRRRPRTTRAGRTRTCVPSVPSAWWTTSGRTTSGSSTSCRATRWARCSAASCRGVRAGIRECPESRPRTEECGGPWTWPGSRWRRWW